jgi:hypothetical protein
MNKLTHEIAAWLNISVEKAVDVQYKMECNDVDFSRSSERTLKREAKSALADLSYENAAHTAFYSQLHAE